METIGADLEVMKRIPLSDDHVAAIREIAEERQYAAGDAVARVGEPMDRFVYVLEGEIEVVDPYSDARLLEASLGPTQFMGELAFLNAGSFTLPMRAAKKTRTLEAPREAMLDLMAKVPELSDHIISVFSARRRKQFEEHRSAIKVIGADRDPDVQAVASFLSRNRIPFQSFDMADKDETTAKLCSITDHRPAVLVGAGEVISEPTPRKVAQMFGLDLDVCTARDVDLLIVGGGPAGVAAAVYAGAEGLDAMVVEDSAIGGQAGISSRIENYMGFPTGVQYRRLPLKRLKALEGAGVYYAATEMEARFCANRPAYIVGGGNSAGQAAMFLSRSASHVHLLVRGDSLADSMSSYLSQRLEADPAISIHYDSQVDALHGGDMLDVVTIDGPDGKRRCDCGALFIMIGAAPNTDWLEGHVALDDKGFVKTGEAVGKPSPYQTSREGIFAVGDVRAGSVKRVASAVGEGSVVVSAIWRHVADAKDNAEGEPGSMDD